MESVDISVLWTESNALVGVSLNGYQGREEVKKVIGVIEDALRSSFPGVLVERLDSVRKIFEPGL